LRKNLYPLNGIPLIAYTIKAAQASRLDDFIVTTDDEEIAAYSESLGCKAVREPAMGQGEPGVIVKSVQYAVAEYERNGDYVDAVCLLQPTSPLRTVEDIDTCLDMWAKHPDTWSIVSVCDGIHPKKSYLPAGERGEPFFDDPTPYDKHINKCYTRNGAVFMIRRHMLDLGWVKTQNPFLYVMPKTRSIDIDDLQDLAIAEALLKAGVVS
jgi:CMP-N,N'-diacetyllegionaminic acid synthase